MSSPARRTLTRRSFAAAIAGAAVGLPALAPATVAGADDKTDKVKQKQKIDQQISDLSQQLDDVDKELADVYLDLRRTELEIPLAQQSLDEAHAALDAAVKHDQEVAERLRAAQSEERRLKGEADDAADAVSESDEQMRRLSLDAYKGGGVPNPASVFVGSKDPQEAVDRSMNYRLALQSQGAELSQLRTQQSVTQTVAERLAAVTKEIDALKKEAAAAVAARRSAEADAKKAKDDLDALYGRQEQQKRDLEAKKKKYAQSQSELKNQSAGLDQDIQRLVAQERAREKAARQPTPVVREAAPAKASGGSRSVSSGTFQRPSDGPLSSPFGWRVHPIYHYRKLHAGQDFAAPCGSPARAIADGRVLSTSCGSASGNKVIVDHGLYRGQSLVSTYHHLQGFAVRPGQQVSKGQTVGWVGTTGSSTGCHLHSEVHINGRPVNPRGYY